MALTLLAEYDFTTMADTSFGAAGTTTGSGGALIDVSGNTARIEGGGGGNGRLVLYEQASVGSIFRRPAGEAYSHAAIEAEYDFSEWNPVPSSGAAHYVQLAHGYDPTEPPANGNRYYQRFGLFPGSGSKFLTVRRTEANSIYGPSFATTLSGSNVLVRSERLTAGPTSWSYKVECPVGSVVSSGTGGSDNTTGWQYAGRMALELAVSSSGNYIKIKKLRFYGEAAPPPLQPGTIQRPVFDADSATVTVTAPTGGVAPYTVQLYSGSIQTSMTTLENTVNNLQLNNFPVTFPESALSPGQTKFYRVVYTDSASGTAEVTNPVAATSTTGLDIADFVTQEQAIATPLPFASDSIMFWGSSSMAGELTTPASNGSAPLKMGEVLQTGGWLNTPNIINKGMPTTTTFNWLPNAANWNVWSTNLLEDMRLAIATGGVRPRFMFVYVGTNDANMTTGIGLSGWEENLKTILEFIMTDASWAGQRPSHGIVLLKPHYVDVNQTDWSGFFQKPQQADMLTMGNTIASIASYINGLSSVQSAGAARVYAGHPDEYRAYIYRATNRLRANEGLHPQVPEGYETMAHLMAVRYLEISDELFVRNPTFSPAAGSYSTSQSVTLSTATSGATIHYTTDGSTPTTSSPTYSTPISVTPGTTTIRAIAVKSGMTDSSISQAVYTVTLGVVAPPVFSPEAGTFGTTQNVSISTTTSGATIRYTTDGSTPTSSSGTVYSGAISVAATTTLRAIAYKTDMTDSSVTVGTFTITPVANPTFSPVAGTYTGTQSVSISTTTSGASIRYTTDGSDPTSSSGTVYSGPISVTQNTTLKAIAYRTDTPDSQVVTAAYTITVATPTFSPVASSYSTVQTVTISSATSGVTIHYTTDGTTPTTSSPTYSSPISVGAGNTTVRALAVKSGMANSAVGSATYVISVAALAAGTLSVAGASTSTISVTWTAASGGTGTIASQLQISADGGTTWTNVSGATTSPAIASGLTPSTPYSLRVRYTDSAATPAIVYSATVSQATEAAPGGGGDGDTSMIICQGPFDLTSEQAGNDGTILAYASDAIPLVCRVIDANGRPVNLAGATLSALLTSAAGTPQSPSPTVTALWSEGGVVRVGTPIPAVTGRYKLTVRRSNGPSDILTVGPLLIVSQAR